MHRYYIIFLIILFLIPTHGMALAMYESISTPSFKIYYRAGWETEALNLLQAMEYCRPYVEDLTGNKVPQVPIVIEDMGNMVNGYTNVPSHKIAVFAYPPSGDILANGEDWWLTVGMHEYIHLAQITKIDDEPALLRLLFGNLLYPNLYQPNWMSEAITVYGESALSKFSGRMNGGTYPAIISALAKEGKMPSLAQAGYYSQSAPLANYYVYGGSFYQYLADTYGQEKFSILFNHTGSNLFSYLNPIYSGLSLDQAYKDTYGKTLQELWAEWHRYEYTKETKFPRQAVTSHGWEISNLKYYRGDLYYSAYHRDKTGPLSSFGSHRIVRLHDPQRFEMEETILTQATEFPAGFQIAGNTLYYSRQEMVKGFDNNEFDGFGVICEIWQKPLMGGGSKKLLKGPIRAFTVLPDGTIITAEDDATHQNNNIYRFDPRADSKELIATLNYLIGGIHHEDGKLFVTARTFYRNNSIFELDLDRRTLKPLIDTPYGESIVLVKDGRIYYEAVYGGNNGMYIFDTYTGETLKLGDFTELRWAVPTEDGKHFFVSMNSRGQDIYSDHLQESRFVLPSERVEPPYSRLEPPADNMVLEQYPIRRGGYMANIGHALWPRLYRIPYIYAAQDTLQLGFQLAGGDILGDIPLWLATMIYDIKEKDLIFEGQVSNNFFRPVKQTLSYSSINGHTFGAQQEIQLLNKLNYGISGLAVGFGLVTSQGMDRKLWYPYVSNSFRWNGGTLSSIHALMYETTDFWASDRDRLGWQSTGNLKQKLGRKMEFRSNIQFAWDPSAGADEVFSSIRGYGNDNKWQYNKGVSLQNTIYTPLIRIRDGIWTPNLYLEDIIVGVFFDVAIPGMKDHSDMRWSAGAELIAELYAAYSYNLSLGLRVSYNKNKDIVPALLIGTDF
ncbi:MAG: hypothetical protein LHW44_03590 [Candidatus Cloacimonetes bacterium]|nr:hypothetical protein [Candidatus Cloacimonadota bacterium]